jgi:hydrogenase maturation protein HypF
LQADPSMILADKHPGYFVSQHGKESAMIKNIPFVTVQHHKAHFGAVLAENNLLNRSEPVLGVIWDGTGYGDDKQIWGSEFFIYDNKEMHRVAQLEYFSQLLGDKMSREPRLSALSLLQFFPPGQSLMQSHFSEKEWQYYQQLLKQPASLLTSSMGRFLDGIASILGICHINTYEGEAAMKLEAFARTYSPPVKEYYPLPLKNNRLDFSLLLQEMTENIHQNKPGNFIAKKIFYSLAIAIGKLSENLRIKRIAFSGGVFQNALLTDMLIELFSEKFKLYWHRQLSPNDECIGFGQLACYHAMIKNNLPEKNQEKFFKMVN